MTTLLHARMAHRSQQAKEDALRGNLEMRRLLRTLWRHRSCQIEEIEAIITPEMALH